jgi:pimeloyl-ACP methyl ester carboxylesterase
MSSSNKQNPSEFKITPFKLKTADRHSLSGCIYERGQPKALILAHGFFNNKDVFLFRKIAEALSADYDVVSFDFRGHGKSSGLFGWTAVEVQDFNQVVKFVQEKGYAQIGVVGFSLGAAVALIAASQNREIESVIAVSAPTDFWKIDFHFWEPEMFEDLKLNLGFKGIGKGVWPGNPFLAKTRPIDVVAAIAPTPVFFIHGEKDWLIKPNHSEKLFQAAKQPKKLAIIPNAGHAEKIFDTHSEEFLSLCRQWLKKTMN